MPRRLPGPFFADVADEVDGAVRLHAGLLERAHHGENHGEPAVVVADARRASLSPSRFTVTSVPSGNTVSRCPAMTTVGPLPEPFRSAITLPAVSMRTFVQAERLEALLELGGAFGFFERRRRDLRQLDLLLERPGVVGFEDVERGADTGVRRRDSLRGDGRGGGEAMAAAKRWVCMRGTYDCGGRGASTTRGP